MVKEFLASRSYRFKKILTSDTITGETWKAALVAAARSARTEAALTRQQPWNLLGKVHREPGTRSIASRITTVSCKFSLKAQ